MGGVMIFRGAIFSSNLSMHGQILNHAKLGTGLRKRDGLDGRERGAESHFIETSTGVPRIRNRQPVGPYSRTMSRALRWS